MRWYLFTLLLSLLTLPLSAQIFGSGSRPAIPVKDPESLRNWLKLEVSGGVNLVARRGVQTRFVTRKGVVPQPGLQLSVNAVLSPGLKTNFILGGGFVWDRGTITGYRKTVVVRITDSNVMTTTTPTRERLGEVSINERWLRGHIGFRFMIGKSLQGLLGFQVSRLLGGTQVYTYTQTTSAFFEPITQRIVPLDEPLVNTGSREFIGESQGGYSGALFGLSYPVTDRLRGNVVFEQGWHLFSGPQPQRDEWRQRRSRLEIGLIYHLASLARR